jgi:hypothetical protein
MGDPRAGCWVASNRNLKVTRHPGDDFSYLKSSHVILEV